VRGTAVLWLVALMLLALVAIGVALMKWGG
jgi:hypothetical protein